MVSVKPLLGRDDYSRKGRREMSLPPSQLPYHYDDNSIMSESDGDFMSSSDEDYPKNLSI